MIRIKELKITDNYQGQSFIDKNGNPYKMVYLTTDDGRKASMYVGNDERGMKVLAYLNSLQVGQEINVIFEQNGRFTNFKFPNKNDELKQELEILKKQIIIINGELTKIKQQLKGSTATSPPKSIQSADEQDDFIAGLEPPPPEEEILPLS